MVKFLILCCVIIVQQLYTRYKLKQLNKASETRDKLNTYYYILADIIRLKQQGKSIAEFFKRHEYNSVAIYGAKELGMITCAELINAGIDVRYFIDRNRQNIQTDIPIFLPEEDLPRVDVIIISAVYYFDEITEDLSDRIDSTITGLDDVILEMINSHG